MHARKVRKTDLPFKTRRSAFRSCIERYHGLIRQKFPATYSRYKNHFGFDSDIPDAGDRLSQAMDALQKERNLFLEAV